MSAPPDDARGIADIHADARRGWLKAVATRGGRLDLERRPGADRHGQPLWLGALASMRRQRGETGALHRFRPQYQVAFIRLDPACRESVLRDGVRLCQR